MRGYDPQFGARPLQRVIQNAVQNPLAEALLAGRFGEGDIVEVRLDPATNTLVFGVGVASDGKVKGVLSDAAGDVAGSAWSSIRIPDPISQFFRLQESNDTASFAR